jgi:hypothetical protein
MMKKLIFVLFGLILVSSAANVLVHLPHHTQNLIGTSGKTWNANGSLPGYYLWDSQALVIKHTGHAVKEPFGVLYEGNPQILTGTVFKLWYCGDTGSDIDVYYAESKDGLTWIDYASTVISGFEHGNVMKNGSTYYIFGNPHTDVTKILRYHSSNGISWTSDGVVLQSSSGKFDSREVTNPYVWIEGSTWYMLYGGNTARTTRKLGLATSKDGLIWTKLNRGNNVLDLGANNSVDGAFCWKTGSTYYIFCHNFVGPYAAQTTSDILMFKSNDLINWAYCDHISGRYVFKRTLDWQGVNATKGRVANPKMIEHNGDLYLYYTAREYDLPSDIFIGFAKISDCTLSDLASAKSISTALMAQ